MSSATRARSRKILPCGLTEGATWSVRHAAHYRLSRPITDEEIAALTRISRQAGADPEQCDIDTRSPWAMVDAGLLPDQIDAWGGLPDSPPMLEDYGWCPLTLRALAPVMTAMSKDDWDAWCAGWVGESYRWVTRSDRSRETYLDEILDAARKGATPDLLDLVQHPEVDAPYHPWVDAPRMLGYLVTVLPDRIDQESYLAAGFDDDRIYLDRSEREMARNVALWQSGKTARSALLRARALDADEH